MPEKSPRENVTSTDPPEHHQNRFPVSRPSASTPSTRRTAAPSDLGPAPFDPAWNSTSRKKGHGSHNDVTFGRERQTLSEGVIIKPPYLANGSEFRVPDCGARSVSLSSSRSSPRRTRTPTSDFRHHLQIYRSKTFGPGEAILQI